MANISDYGTILSSGSTYATTTGSVIKISSPKVKNPAVNATNHGSNGYKEQISSRLVEMDDFAVTISFDKTQATTFFGYVTAGSLIPWRITWPNSGSLTFSAILTEFAPADADAQNPTLLTADLTFAPSGVVTFA